MDLERSTTPATCSALEPSSAAALAHRFLRACDAQHRVRRLRAVGPRREELALRGDRAFVVALPGVSHADPVLRIGRERAAGIGHQEALHRRDRHRVVAELELVERRLVGLRLARGSPFDLAGGRWRLVGARSLLLARLLELPQARVDVDVQVFLPPVGGLDLVGEDLDLPADARDFGAQPLQLPGEIEQRAALAGRGLELAKAIFERLLARLDLLAQQLDAATRFVIVEKPLRERRPGERAAEREGGSLAYPWPAHQYSPL